jgi:hypothetical protein
MFSSFHCESDGWGSFEARNRTSFRQFSIGVALQVGRMAECLQG